MDRQTAEHAARVLWQHLAPLRPYLDNPAVQEVMINHPDDVWVEEQGVMRRLDLRLDSDQVDAVIKILANLNNKPDSLILDCRLPGLRVAAARHPIAVRGHSMCIRKHAAQKLSIAYYLESGAFAPVDQERFSGASGIPAEIAATLEYGGQALADFLTWAVRARKNILISGSTSSGKTTLIGALLDLVQQDDRLIIIEDTGELSELHFDAPNRVHFESNDALGVSIRDLVRLSLRYRPTRVIDGEVRGAEAFDVLNAYNTGHAGGMVSLHADSAVQALVAFETKVRMSPDAKDMPLASLRAQIAETFSYVIHSANAVGVTPPRAPIEVIAVTGLLNDFYATQRLYSRFTPVSTTR
jgi:Flp pilus assembly CpaF family ATPase